MTKKSLLLYAITDRSWLKENTLEQTVEEVLRGGATFLQLREKMLDRPAFLAEAKRIKAVAAIYQVPFVVNDDIEIALESDADGVHVGQSDIKEKDVRALIGPDKILGISANTVETAQAAQAAGADYIGVGAVFPTGTKGDAVQITPAALAEISAAVTIPVVAIGGITEENLPTLANCGIAGAAIISAIFKASCPEAATRRLRRLAEAVVAHG
ncbi:MAG: thiamine phosphate synthase [Oscillibacter sp.]